MRILVTGASGFVGGALVSHLQRRTPRHQVAVVVRRGGLPWPEDVLEYLVRDLSATSDWSAALRGVSAIVHCAARVHMMQDAVADRLIEFRRVNVDGTLNLAKQAAAAGVKRFVYVSSIKVNGESTVSGWPFRADDEPNPQDPYGISKYEAEVGLRLLGEQTGMEVVIVRTPLVYGPRVPANFLRLLHLVKRRLPLPFGRIRNRRSMVSLGNLVDLLASCLQHPAAAGQTFLVSDGQDVSTPGLIRRMGEAMRQSPLLLPVPVSMLRLAGGFVGRVADVDRLTSSLQVDIEHTCKTLDWIPPIRLDEGLKITVDWYLSSFRD